MAGTSGASCSRRGGHGNSAQKTQRASVLHPYLVGRELNSTGQPSRFILDIGDDAALAASFEGSWRL